MVIPIEFILALLIILSFVIGYYIAKIKTTYYWKTQVPSLRKDAVSKSRAVLAGQFSEQLAPFMPDFPFNPSEARFIGKPIDFIVFEGMDEKNIQEIAFVEVKSGNSKLSPVQQQIKDLVKKGKVSWYEYRVPEGLTKKED